MELNKQLLAHTNGQPVSDNVIISNNVKVTVLTPSMIRVEYSTSEKFTDLPSQSIWYRNFGKVEFSHNPFSMPQGGLEALKTQKTDETVKEAIILYDSHSDKNPNADTKPAEEKKVIDTDTGVISSNAPVMSLYDLFNFTAEERRAAETGQKTKSAKGGKKGKNKPIQPSLFDMSAVPNDEPKKVEEVKPPVQEPKEEPKAEATSSTVDPDDIYATINWEDNPPINGFYEMMMDLTPEQRKAQNTVL